MYLRERRICNTCGAYYDEKRLEKGFKKFLYKQSYLDYPCKNCQQYTLMLEIEVVNERLESERAPEQEL